MSSLATPQVSIVLPAYDRLRFLQPALASVFAQTFQDWELLVADDGSGALTRAWLDSLTSDARVRILHLAHAGNPAAARNAALRAARGTWVAFLDSDDLWMPAKLERQLAAMRAAPARRWSYTAIVRIEADGAPRADEPRRVWVPFEGDIVDAALRSQVGMATPTVMAERELIAAAGGFDESLQVHEDVHLWIRLALRSEVTCIREPLAQVRCHDEHYSLSGRHAVEGWDRMLASLQSAAQEPAHAARLAALLPRARARTAARLARLHAASGEGRAMLRALAHGSSSSWRYADWWAGAALATARLIAGRRPR